MLREAEPNIVGVENSSNIKHSLENSVGPINIVTHSQKLNVYPEAIGRRSTQPSSRRGIPDKPRIVDLNSAIEFPANQGRKKNKNDFYRFLLQQNLSAEMLSNPSLMQALNTKINNDILIPRSILKKHVGAPKQKEEQPFDFLDELEDLNNDNILYNEAVVGR